MPKSVIKLEASDSDSADELDLIPLMLDSESSTLVETSPSNTSSSSSPRTPKHSSSSSVAHRTSRTSPILNAPQPSRKRKVSENHDQHSPARSQGVHKRSKLEEKKAATVHANAKRLTVDAARRCWLYHHRSLFTPVLPLENTYFSKLVKEHEAKREQASFVALRQFQEQPRSVVGGEMMDYQLRGLSFLAWMYKNGMNCILGDEMGLGKTLQTLSLFAYIKDTNDDAMDPHLIVCPLSVVETWIKEAAYWVPSLRMFRFHAEQQERERLKLAIRDGKIEFDVCVTTYEGYAAEDTWFKSRRWTYLVLDEGHRIKNSETQMSGKLQGIQPMYRLILTGTPVQNNLVELWGLLRWLYPAIFRPNTERAFQEAFDLGRGSYSMDFLKATEELLSTIMLRRTKKSVDIKVPPREELTVFVPMSEAQRFWTYRMLMRLDTKELEAIFMTKDEGGSSDDLAKEYITTKLRESKLGKQNQWKRLMNLLLQLRQVCDHPYMLPNAEPTPYAIGEHVVASSSKLIVVDKLLKDLLPKGERVLIFSQFTSMLDLLEDFMALRRIPYARLCGATPRPRRTLDIRLFQQEISPYQVYLISTKAGGLGINLTKASVVIMFDSEWNPQNDLQAIARAHRIGQTKIVKVYRLICQGSVEDQMLDRIRRKLFLSLKVIKASGEDDENHDQSMKTREILDILRKGSSALSRTGGLSLSEFLSAPIMKILEASRAQNDYRAIKIKKECGEDIKAEEEEQIILDAEEEEKKLLSGVAQVQSRLFEGQVIQRAKDNKEVAEEWRSLQKEANHSSKVMIDGQEVSAADLGIPAEATSSVADSSKASSRKHEWEDWCIYCRDGGEVVLCGSCPRVFHAACHGMSRTAAANSLIAHCPQHACAVCERKTAACGGMLFRCRTCPKALCEDCLPGGDLYAIGDTLPEFLIRNYGAKGNAYYITCDECRQQFEDDPVYWRQWQAEFREAERKLDALWDA